MILPQDSLHVKRAYVFSVPRRAQPGGGRAETCLNQTGLPLDTPPTPWLPPPEIFSIQIANQVFRALDSFPLVVIIILFVYL